MNAQIRKEILIADYSALLEDFTAANGPHRGSNIQFLSALQSRVNNVLRSLNQNRELFEDNEITTILLNASHMNVGLQSMQEKALEELNHGIPRLVTSTHTGNRGRPRREIDPHFLQDALRLRGIRGVARFLGVGISTVVRRMQEHGIASAQEEDIVIPYEILHCIVELILTARPTLGGRMVRSTIKTQYGFKVSRKRVQLAMRDLNRSHKFENVPIQRRVYKVPGPNALWHHDGQHGLIRWGIVIHAFIDGHSRLVTGIRASGNNKAVTVLDLFFEATSKHLVPSRVRGDHGTENLLVATWMEHFRGSGRGSYIWGRSVHNVRIERLWRDVTNMVGRYWKDFFYTLEESHGLRPDNIHHKWLLQHLFLPRINEDLQRFAQIWNDHNIEIRDGPNRSPNDIWFFDQITNGFRGDSLPENREPILQTHLDLDPHPLEADEIIQYGIDWAEIPQNEQHNHLTPIWNGHDIHPPHMNEVSVEEAHSGLSVDAISYLDTIVAPWQSLLTQDTVINVWRNGLAACRMFCLDIF